jgi:hypothetical protein
MPARNPVLVVPTGVKPLGVTFQPVGTVATFEGIQPTVIWPKERVAVDVTGCGVVIVFWLTWTL